MNINSGIAILGNLQPTTAQNLDNEEIDISQKGKWERPISVSGSDKKNISNKQNRMKMMIETWRATPGRGKGAGQSSERTRETLGFVKCGEWWKHPTCK
jgi:hypothetical protein